MKIKKLKAFLEIYKNMLLFYSLLNAVMKPVPKVICFLHVGLQIK